MDLLTEPRLRPRFEARIRSSRSRIRNAKEAREAGLHAGECARSGKSYDWHRVEETGRIVERLRRLGMAREAEELAEDPDAPVLEKIIAENDLLASRFLSDGARAARAVGRIRVLVRGTLGTGFMISPRVLMTNNHVLESRRDAAGSLVEFDFYERASGAVRPIETYAFAPDALFLTDPDLDYTIVAVAETSDAGDPVAARGWLPVSAASGKAVVGERVNIIQHPGGRPQEVAIHSNQVAAVVDDFLHYVTDSEPGSSGSPVCNDQWEVAALHHASRGDVNEGARISRVVADIAARADGPGIDRALMADVLAATPPPSREDAPPTPPGLGATTLADGGAIVVPIEVRVGPPEPPPTGVPGAPAASEVPAGDPLLDDALGQLRAARAATYYAADADALARDGYWGDVDGGAEGENLLAAIGERLRTDHAAITRYRDARLMHLYPRVDLHPGGGLAGVYTGTAFDPSEVLENEVAMERAREEALRRVALESEGDAAATAALLEALEVRHPFNCEHVVPQSWFRERESGVPEAVMRSDLHHLFTCEWSCNSTRGNHAYYEFRKKATGCGLRETGKFEPANGKGAVARATLYFLARYPGEVHGSAELPAKRIATLVRWARREPPTLWEQHRNAEIFAIQGNRSPFIDFPAWADQVGDAFRGALTEP